MIHTIPFASHGRIGIAIIKMISSPIAIIRCFSQLKPSLPITEAERNTLPHCTAAPVRRARVRPSFCLPHQTTPGVNSNNGFPVILPVPLKVVSFFIYLTETIREFFALSLFREKQVLSYPLQSMIFLPRFPAPFFSQTLTIRRSNFVCNFDLYFLSFCILVINVFHVKILRFVFFEKSQSDGFRRKYKIARLRSDQTVVGLSRYTKTVLQEYNPFEFDPYRTALFL